MVDERLARPADLGVVLEERPLLEEEVVQVDRPAGRVGHRVHLRVALAGGVLGVVQMSDPLFLIEVLISGETVKTGKCVHRLRTVAVEIARRRAMGGLFRFGFRQLQRRVALQGFGDVGFEIRYRLLQNRHRLNELRGKPLLHGHSLAQVL